ncbi:LysR family transcriptional regulator [Roseobacter sp. HKCCA0434]|uniref:LysR family transcriptional regulator n=1 Tax=Roseobacter sp. HKCCA0434 TaxID=3079297 RepID=UPI002905EA0B|nr:LysR family transcriptional regulator [Roseobacter sp. HKCCA0434]
MNWQAITFDWNQARAVLVTAREGSLSAAARALGLAQPTLGRQVAALEAELGVTLFDRVGRTLVLTEIGARLCAHLERMADAAADVSALAAGQAREVTGLVRISATDVMAVDVLPPILADLRREAPGLELEIVTSNGLSDLRRREADIALRHARPEQPELYARKLGETTAHLYAASGWISRHGRPRVPSDLAGHGFAMIERSPRMDGFLREMGLPVDEMRVAVVSHSGIAMREMVRHGAAITFMTRDMAEAVPGLERVLPDLPPIPVPLWLVAHAELMTSARVRLVFDRLAAALSRG